MTIRKAIHTHQAFFQVGGSGWTEAIPLDSSPGAADGQTDSKPFLIRAKVPEWGQVHEFIAFSEFAGAGFERTMVGLRSERFLDI